MRPFHFITVFWGARFTDYFAEFALPSLLAPGNLPSLKTSSKLLIACYPQDAATLKTTTIYRKALQYVEIVFLNLPKCPPNKNGCQHMGVGHKMACQIAYDERGYGCILAPDTIISDGAIAALQRHAEDGKKLVLAPACLRLAEEPFFRELMAMGALSQRSRKSSGEPIIATGAQLAEASIRSLHSASRINEWDAPYLPVSRGAPCVFFRASGNEGFLIHCLSWAPLLIDYAAFAEHDTSCLENWTIDGDYVFKNLGDPSAAHVVTDSDELVYAGFTPRDEQPIDLTYYFRDMPQSDMEAMKLKALRDNYECGIFDPLKKRLFHEPVLWHGHELDERWSMLASRARGLVDRALAA